MKGKKIVFTMFIVMALLDLGVTMYGFYINGHTEMETNPLFIMTKSMWPLILANVIFAVCIWFGYRKDINPFFTYLLSAMAIQNSLMRIPVIINNWNWVKHPISAEVVKQTVTTTEKVAQYNNYILLQMYLPLAVLLFVYLIWQLDYDIKCTSENAKTK